MANGANKLMQIMKDTSEKAGPEHTKLITMVVKKLQPLTFKVDDKLDITEEFCVFSKIVDKNALAVGDIVTAFVMNDGQRYFIQQNEDKAIPQGAAVIDNLSSTSTTDALSANQGRILNNNKFDKTGGTVTGNIKLNGDLDFSNNSWAAIKWKEDGFGDKFEIRPNFNGTDADNHLILYTATGEAGTDPEVQQRLFVDCHGHITGTDPWNSAVLAGNGGIVALRPNTANSEVGQLAVSSTGSVEFVSRKQYNTGTRTPASWYYIGDFEFDGQGKYAVLNGCYGNGQNGEASQQVLFKLTMMQGWNKNSDSTTDNIGLAVNFEQNYLNTLQFKINQTDAYHCSLYMYMPTSYWNLSYTIDGSANKFTPINSVLSSEPTSTKTATIYQSIHNDETVEKSLKIPKNGALGYGLCNSDGSPIIRDHNNGCVTVDATGSYLYLGHTNTTGLNILNGKWTMNSSGQINSNFINEILWSGVLYMNASQSASLSKSLSKCNTGIILHWQGYRDGAVQNYDHTYTFVPKHHGINTSGSGVFCLMGGTNGISGYKYVYVDNTQIRGHAKNEGNQTSGNYSYSNSSYVLTHVFAV